MLLNEKEIQMLDEVMMNDKGLRFLKIKDRLIVESLHNSRKSIRVETDSLSVMDKDGKIIVTKQESANFKNIYNNSHRLIKIYMESNNVEGIKYELCKLWYLLVIIEERVVYAKGLREKVISENKKKEAMECRAFILSDFKRGLKFVMNEEPDFNFQEYFKVSCFGQYTVEIDKNDLKALLNLIRFLI